MNASFIKNIFFLLVFIALSSFAYCQDSGTPKGSTRQKKKSEIKRKEREDKAVKGAYEERQQKHMDLQSKETKKRMKETQKKSKKHNDKRNGVFIKRNKKRN